MYFSTVGYVARCECPRSGGYDDVDENDTLVYDACGDRRSAMGFWTLGGDDGISLSSQMMGRCRLPRRRTLRLDSGRQLQLHGDDGLQALIPIW